ncbi:MAG: potassium transporter KefB [Rhodothermaceae bacterium]|nr:MAG: potassium transporter KefB [Rhodothermaceae bacterium]
MPYPVLAVTLPFLGEIVALLAGSVLIAYLCHRIRLVPIVGFLLAGVVIGPTALGLVTDQALIDGMAEVGVILLLFTIGVEFSLERLDRIRRLIFFGGGLQVGLTVLVVMLVLLAAGVAWPVGVFTGCLVALSSTAIVLKLLDDRDETDTPEGRLALAILIFQDLAIILMVLLVPMLGGQGGTPLDLARAFAEALLLIAVVLVVARKVLPPLLERIARTQRSELFLPTVVTICFGTAWLTSLAGVSLALGAFLGGLVVSESRYSAYALSEILPLRTLFNAVFFVSVGMLLDVGFLLDNLPLVLGVAGAVLLVKVGLTTFTVRVVGYPLRVAVVVGLGLAQIGEFSFVLARAGESAGLTPAGLGTEGVQAFIAVTVLLMAATPLLLHLGHRLAAWVERSDRFAGDLPAGEEAAAPPLEDHVIIVGYGPAGERLAQVLKDTGLPFEVIEMDPVLADRAEEDGFHVVRGDAGRPHILEHAGINRAKLLVVVINDEAATLRIVEVAHYLNPTVQIIARTRFLDHIERLQQAGADIVVPEELETSVRIFTNVLAAYMVPPDEINRKVAALRSGDYQVFRSQIHEAHMMVLQGLDEEGLHTRAVAVRPGAPVAGKTLGELDLRRRYNLTVLAIRRDGRTIANPSGDFRIEPGDRLVLIGEAEQFARCADLFREAPPPSVSA